MSENSIRFFGPVMGSECFLRLNFGGEECCGRQASVFSAGAER